jgi:hypothetical protein
MVVNDRGSAMSAGQINSARGRRARSAEDESPVIVAAIAVLAVVVLSCVGMLAPVLWDGFVGGSGLRLSEQACSPGTAAADTARCPDNTRFQPVRPRPRAQFEPLIPHL